jgi:zinc protease
MTNKKLKTAKRPGVSRKRVAAKPRPPVEQYRPQPRLDVERVELNNGLVLLLSANRSIPSISASVIVRAGSRFESDEKAGLASLVGELLAEGTESRSSQEIAELIESRGARLATFGDYQVSGIHASFLSRDFSALLGIMSDLLTTSVFPDEKVRQWIDRRSAQIRSRLDIPRIRASDLFNETVFENHPLHRPPIGYEHTVQSLTRSDVVAYYRRFYAPNNTILAVSGDIDKSGVVKAVEETLGNWPRKELQLPQISPPVVRFEPCDRFAYAEKEQVNIFMGHVGIRRTNPDYYALLVLDTILGSSPGFTSRIPRILRDQQGLAYHTFSNITATSGLDPGRFVAYIGTAPQNLERAIAGLRNEIERIVREPVSRPELATAKAYLTGNFVFDFQTNAQVAHFLIDAEIYGLGFDYLQKYPELISSVTIKDVSRVAKEYIRPDSLTTVVVGPETKRGHDVLTASEGTM